MKSRNFVAFAVVVATSALLSSQAAFAQSSTDASATSGRFNMAAARQEAALMVPATALLSHEIDARKAHSGEQFQAQLTKTIYLKNGAVLPKGTELIGTIARDKMNADGTSSLALRFTKADLKNGTIVPIEATIMDVSRAVDPMDGYISDARPLSTWDGKVLMIDQLGAISGFDLHSKIANPDSGVFVSRKKDEVKLGYDTQLSLAIAGRSATAKSGGA